MSNAAVVLTPRPSVDRDLDSDLERFVSEQEYWEHYYEAEGGYEWNNGRLEIKPVSDHQTYLTYAWFFELLRHYLSVHPIAQTTGLEIGFRLPLPHKTVIRKPDLGVVRNDNQVALKPLDRTYKGVFDLCIEVLSDSTRQEMERDTRTKKAEYLAGGVTEYFILHPDPERRFFFKLESEQGIYAPIEPQEGETIYSKVLPGFRFKTDDLALRPTVEQMMADAVYRDFVLPAWQVEARARREAEEQANKQAQRVEEEARARRKAEEQANEQAQRVEEEARARRKAEEQANEQAQRAAAAEAEVARLRALLDSQSR